MVGVTNAEIGKMKSKPEIEFLRLKHEHNWSESQTKKITNKILFADIISADFIYWLTPCTMPIQT